jgi:hypothetical protein
MTARDSYVSSAKSAEATKLATIGAAETTKQEAINASGVNVGYTLQSGNYSNFAAAIAAANAAKAASLYAAEVSRQAALAVARDTLRTTGDLAPT